MNFMNKQLSIIVDSNYLCYRAFHTTGFMSYGDDGTGIIYGFLKSIEKIIERFKTIDLVFAWDSRESLRKEILPTYKSREHLKEEERELRKRAFVQFNILRENVLTSIGFKNVFMFPGYESDDIIAYCVKNYKRDWIIVSSDHDLYQLLDRSSMFSINTDKLFTSDDFVKEYSVDPSYWGMAKAIAGCEGDKVPGVSGVAEKTAIKYLKGELKKDSVKYKSIISSLDIIERNKKLVILPFAGLDFKLYRQTKNLDIDAFANICVKYGFQTFDINKIKKIFDL